MRMHPYLPHYLYIHSRSRRDDEMPFVVERFAKQGIRIFSVKEGEQKFEIHTDSLINYIR